jgi:predicted RNA methylase
MPLDEEIIQMRAALCHGKIDDPTFDRLYPDAVRAVSPCYWTPVAVAYRAAQLFASQDVKSVLDVGSGAGKFCLTAACSRPDVIFTGIEQRPHLVETARQVAARLRIENVRFHSGDATDLRSADHGGFYLYNPFAENVYNDQERLDSTVELSRSRFFSDVWRMFFAFTSAPLGTSIVTYNSFGGPIPSTYELVHAERAEIEWLRLWVKRRQPIPEVTYYLENEDGVTPVRITSSILLDRISSCA